MSLEFRQSKIWEDKLSPNFKAWLIEQAKRDPSVWNADFEEYVRIKTQIQAQENEVVAEKDPAKERAQNFRRYLEILDLSEAELKDQKILDLGCGEGEFVAECLERGLTREAYGFDSGAAGHEFPIAHADHFRRGDFAEALPYTDIDRIVSVGALSLYLSPETAEESQHVLRLALAAAKTGGEIRIGPIYAPLRGELSGIEAGQKALRENLEKLSVEFDISWELRPTDIHVSGQDNDVMLNQVLVIRKET